MARRPPGCTSAPPPGVDLTTIAARGSAAKSPDAIAGGQEKHPSSTASLPFPIFGIFRRHPLPNFLGTT
jgi:hypothetical protein